MKSQNTIYWILFVATFLAVAVWESFYPNRRLTCPAEHRWGRHAAMFALTAVLQNFILHLSPFMVAAAAADSRFGILNRPWLPFPVRCVAAVLLLDFAQYWFHRGFHAVSWLWRVHEVHHSDPDYDVSTAARFHPIETIFAQAVRLPLIALLAPPPVAIFAGELLGAALNLFSHANASLPRPVERWLRALVITPDLHRIHHSEEITDQQRNFGQSFPWWDRLFGTYAAAPVVGKEGMVTGLRGMQNEGSLGLGFMLAEPFRPRSQTDVLS